MGLHFVIYIKSLFLYPYFSFRNVKENVKKAIADHFQLEPSSLHLTHPTFFSRIDSKPARTMHDEYWHVHVDKVYSLFGLYCFFNTRNIPSYFNPYQLF